MNCRDETAGDSLWTFCPDPVAVPGGRMCGLMRARLVDEITRLPVDADAVRVAEERIAAHVVPRAAAGGLVGLAGVPSEAFPRLATQSAQAALSVRVDGYVPLTLRATFTAQAAFPSTFLPRDLGTVGLRRRGVELAGRVVVAGLPHGSALVGATVQLEGMWLQAPLPGVSLAASMLQPFVVALSSPLARDWPSAQLDPCDEVPDAVHAKRLVAPAPAGSTQLRLSDRDSLAVPGPVLIDGDDPSRSEVMAVQSIDTALDAGQPCRVDLEYPTQHLHRADAPVVPLAVTPVAGTGTLARPAAAGDAVAFLAAAAPWTDGRLVRIHDGALAPEFRRIARHETTTDADGYFRWPLLSRLALVQVRVTHASRPAPLRSIVTLDYRSLQQQLLLAFE
jgi:hypothetical protein